MSEFLEPNAENTAATPRWVGLASAVLGGVSLIGAGLGIAAWNTSRNVEQSTQASLKQQNDALARATATISNSLSKRPRLRNTSVR